MSYRANIEGFLEEILDLPLPQKIPSSIQEDIKPPTLIFRPYAVWGDPRQPNNIDLIDYYGTLVYTKSHNDQWATKTDYYRFTSYGTHESKWLIRTGIDGEERADEFTVEISLRDPHPKIDAISISVCSSLYLIRSTPYKDIRGKFGFIDLIYDGEVSCVSNPLQPPRYYQWINEGLIKIKDIFIGEKICPQTLHRMVNYLACYVADQERIYEAPHPY